MQAWRAAFPAPRASGVVRGSGRPAIGGQPLDRLGEGEPLGLHQEIEDIAVLARGKVEPGHLLVVDIEGGRLLGVEGREAAPFAPGLGQLHPAAHDLGDRHAGLQFVEEGGWESHRRL